VNALWISLALLAAGFVGWPVTALVFRLARTIDDRTIDHRTVDHRAGADGAGDDRSGADGAGDDRAGDDDPAADTTTGVVPGAEAGAAGVDVVSSARILRGGAIIGILERLAVCLAVLAGQPVAIAYVVAIKGLGRFAELKETPVAAERFIIGTLTSMLWAAGMAALAKVYFLG
jgi:hypothetical protein